MKLWASPENSKEKKEDQNVTAVAAVTLFLRDVRKGIDLDLAFGKVRSAGGPLFYRIGDGACMEGA